MTRKMTISKKITIAISNDDDHDNDNDKHNDADNDVCLYERYITSTL